MADTNQFEDFISRELPLRPVLVNDVPQESLLVRRGEGPRLFSYIELDDDHLIIKRNGQLSSIHISELKSVEITATIEPGVTQIIPVAKAEVFRSRMFFLEIEKGDDSVSWTVNAKANKLKTEVDYVEYARLGDSIQSSYDYDMSIDEDGFVVFSVTNTGLENIECLITVI